MRSNTHLQVVEKTGYNDSVDDLSSIIADLASITDELDALLNEIGDNLQASSLSVFMRMAKMLTTSVDIIKRVCHPGNKGQVKSENAHDDVAALRRWVNTLTKNDQQTRDDIIASIEVYMDRTVAAQNDRSRRGDGRDLVWYWNNVLDVFIQDSARLYDLTLLKPETYDYIEHKVKEYIEAHGGKLYYDIKLRKSDPGNRSKLTISHVVFMAFFIKRTGLLPVVAGALFGIDRTTVGRQYEFIDDVLEAVLPSATTMRERLKAIETSEEYMEYTGGNIQIDGTIIPAHKSNDKDNPETSGYSGKHKMYGFNAGVTITGTGKVVSVDSAPGNEHDYTMLKNNPPDLGLFNMSKEPETKEEIKVMDQIEVYVDKGYTGIKKDFGFVKSNIPHKGRNKKSPKEIKEAFKTEDDTKIAEALGLTPAQYAENKEISSKRSLNERIIGSMKRWGVLAGPFYGTSSDLKQQLEIISGIVNLETEWEGIERDEASLLAALAKKRANYTKHR